MINHLKKQELEKPLKTSQHPKLKIIETTAKKILARTQVPSADFTLNPYTGCQFACQYCFASFMGRFVGETTQNWGNYVYVKTNAVELLKKEIHGLIKKDPPPKIAISTVTDPYQGVEKHYRLTRGALKVFAEHNYLGRVSILTKSPMVLQDIETLKQIRNSEVGLTITTSDDTLSRFLESQAPLASARIKTLKALNEQGIKTYVFIGPLLPHMKYRKEELHHLFSQISKAGTHDIKIEYLNLTKHARIRLGEILPQETPEIQAAYKESQSKSYRTEMDLILREMIKEYGFTLRFGEIVHHVGQQNLQETTPRKKVLKEKRL